MFLIVGTNHDDILFYESSLKNKREEIILNYLRENGSISNKNACKLIGLKATAVKAIFTKMVNAGLISPIGEKKSRKYILPKR